MSKKNMRRILASAAGLGLAACSGDTSSAAPQASGSPSAAAAKVDLPSFCEKVCKRSTACGIEAAESLAKGHANELAVVEQLRKDAPKTEQTCRESCTTAAVGSDDQADLAAANGCLEQTSCATFESCLSAVDKPAAGADARPPGG